METNGNDDTQTQETGGQEAGGWRDPQGCCKAGGKASSQRGIACGKLAFDSHGAATCVSRRRKTRHR
jgi:hypothetical protein